MKGKVKVIEIPKFKDVMPVRRSEGIYQLNPKESCINDDIPHGFFGHVRTKF